MATRRSTARRAARGRRPVWRISPPRGGCRSGIASYTKAISAAFSSAGSRPKPCWATRRRSFHRSKDRQLPPGSTRSGLIARIASGKAFRYSEQARRFPEDSSMSIVVRTLSERVFEVVREQIVSGQLPHDLPIRQDALAAELGVSKIPLREALARLEQEGLLTSHANRGYFVQPMSSAQAEEIFDLRLAIEPVAAARAARYATDSDQLAATESFELLDRAAS